MLLPPLVFVFTLVLALALLLGLLKPGQEPGSEVPGCVLALELVPGGL